MRFKPVDGVLRIKLFEGFSQEFFTAGVFFGKQSAVEGRIRHITSSATGNLHLAQEFAGLFQDAYMRSWEMGFGGNCGEETGGSSSDDGDFQGVND